MIDREDWIINHCEELAVKLTGIEFDSLNPQMQMTVFMQAEKDYADHYASEIDRAYDAWRDSQLNVELEPLY